MNHGKHADSCYFFRDDARAQQASGDTSLGANEELRRSFSNFVFSFINIPLIPLSSAGDTLVDIKQRFVLISTNSSCNNPVLVLHRPFRFTAEYSHSFAFH